MFGMKELEYVNILVKNEKENLSIFRIELIQWKS